MEKTLLSLFFSISMLFGATAQQTSASRDSNGAKEDISEMLQNWHTAAGDANFEEYFGYVAKDGIFIGTDPTENWTKPEFEKWARPYFDSGKAWNFKTLKRNIFLAEEGDLAWFDELLETQMGICRGSGVVKKVDGEWKVQHYVLSISIPNEDVDEVTEIKRDFDQKLMNQLKSE